MTENHHETTILDIIEEIGDHSKDYDPAARATAMIDEARDFKITFGSETGRRCLNAILKHCGFLDTKVARDQNGAVDPNGTLVLVGMGNVGTYIMNRRSVDIGRLEAMLKARQPMEKGDDR